MRKQAMFFGVKDSLIAAVLFAITVVLYSNFANSNNPGWADLGILLLGFGAAIYTMRFLTALGATALLGGSYHANKSEYSPSFAVFNEDRKSSILHILRAIFFYIIGIFIYPIAILVSIINYKEFFNRDQSYADKTQQQMAKQDYRDALDSSTKTSDKKWKVSAGLIDDHYFHSEKEAYEFILLKGLDTKPIKLLS